MHQQQHGFVVTLEQPWSALCQTVDSLWGKLTGTSPAATGSGHQSPRFTTQRSAWAPPTWSFNKPCKHSRPAAKACSLQFQLPQPAARRVVRMPLPFASINGVDLTATGNPQLSSQQVPTLVRTPAPEPNAAGGSKGSPQKEERILISEVEVVGVDGELKEAAKAVLKTRPMFAYTFNEVKQDVARVFATGWFRECVPDAQDTRDGVKLIIKVTPNDEVRGMVAAGTNVLPNDVVQDAFKDLYGKTLNFATLRQAVSSLDKWYSERGILGQVTDVDFADGVISLSCAEAVVNNITLAFLDAKTQAPVEKPRTRQEVITRHINTQPGQVYNLKQAKRDIAAVYATGLFEDVNITPKESEDSTETAPKIDLIVNLVERKTGGLGAGGGLSSVSRGDGGLPGFVGSFSYSERNLFGLNQKLSALVELGQVDKIFKIQHTDPWILGDPHRTSRTVQLLNNRTSGMAIHGRVEADAGNGGAAASNGSGSGSGPHDHAPGGDPGNLMIGRLIASVEYQRPLSTNWSGTLGGNICRTTCLTDTGTPTHVDCYGAPLTFSGGPADHMAMMSGSTSYSSPEDGMALQFSLDSALPVRHALHSLNGWLSFTRLRARVDKPINLFGPLSLICRARGGVIFGDLPPYEAFTIGGTNSVRGYVEGGVGTGRRWLEGSAELRFPLVSMLSGCVFADWGSDLDSGTSVIGDPAGARGKPGHGAACGAGVRVETPVGPLRLEYAWNAAKHGRFHVGVGYD